MSGSMLLVTFAMGFIAGWQACAAFRRAKEAPRG